MGKNKKVIGKFFRFCIEKGKSAGRKLQDTAGSIGFGIYEISTGVGVPDGTRRIFVGGCGIAGGLYELGETQMIVSRGLCKNELPRVFNPPELVVINIKPKTA